MNEDALNETLAQWKNAVDRLGEAVAEKSPSQLMIDGTIQRFEFTFELSWKAMQKILRVKEDIDVPSPKQTLQKAYRLEWIDDEDLWVRMLKDRNMTSHTYKQELAKEIYGRIKTYYPEFVKLYEKLGE